MGVVAGVASADYDKWAADQAKMLRTGATDGLDRQGLASVIQALSEHRKATARAAVRRVVSSMLLHEKLPAHYRCGMMARAVAAMHDLSDVMAPSLSEDLRREYAGLYAAAMLMASEEMRDLGGNPAMLPRVPPWTWDDVFGPWGSLPG